MKSCSVLCNAPCDYCFKLQYPVGMAKEVLIFVCDVLRHLERPLLHHVSIHQPIMVKGGLSASTNWKSECSKRSHSQVI